MDELDQREIRKWEHAQIAEAIANQAADSILITDANGTILYANPEAQRAFGFTAAELCGASLHRLLHHSRPTGEPFPDTECTLVAAIGQGTAVKDLEHVFIRKDGTRVPVSCSSAFMPQIGEQPPGAVVVIRDITRRSQEQAETAEWKRRYELALRAAGKIVFEAADATGEVLFAGDCEGVLGYSCEELRGRVSDFLTHLHDDDRDAIAQELQQAEQTKRPFDIEYRFVRKDRHVLYVRVSGTFLGNGPSRPLGIAGIISDVTARKQAEVAVAQSERRFRQTIEGLPSLFWTADAAGRTTYLSPQWIRYTGDAELEQDCEKWRELIHPDDKAEIFAGWQRIREAAQPARAEFRLRRYDGVYRYFEFRALPIQDEQGRVTAWFGANSDIHEEHELREALLKEHRRFTNLCETMPGAIYTFIRRRDGSVYVAYASPGYAELAGSPPEELTEDASAVFHRLHPDHVAHVTAAFERSARDLTTWREEFQFLHPTRGPIWVDARAVPHREPDGTTVWQGIVLDVTARKQGEEALRHSEEQFRLLADAMPHLVWQMSTEGNFEYVNQYFTEFTRTDPALITPDRWEQWIHPEDMPCVLEMWDRLQQGAASATTDARLRRWDEVYRWFTLRSVAMSRPGTSGWVTTGTDIDSLKTAQAELRSSEERLRLATSAARIGTWDYDPATDVMAVGRVAAEIFAAEPDRVTRSWIVRHIHPEDREDVRARWAAALAGENDGQYAVEYRLVHPATGGIRYIQSRGEVIFEERDGVKKPLRFVGASQDVTARKRGEQALRRLNEDLRQFAYAAAHDLQEPLRNIANSLGLAKQIAGPHQDAMADELIEEAIQNAQRMHRMVRDLLAFSKVGDRVPEVWVPVSSKQSLEAAITNLQALIEEANAEIVYGDLPQVWMHETHLVQLFQNLVGNALKYRDRTRRPRIEISANRRGPEWVFSIADNGIGFDPAYADRIFGIFKRLHAADEYPGTGIGLALCSRLVRIYGGRIWAEGKSGKGATFWFTVPAERSSEAG